MDTIISFLRKFNIRNRIMLFLLLGLLLFSGTILYASKFFSQYLIRSNLYNYLELTQQEIGSSVELIVDEINMLSVKLLVNQGIYSLLDDKSLSRQEKEERLKQLLDGLLVHKEMVGDIIIITGSNEMYSYLPDSSFIQKPDETYIQQIEKSAIPVWGTVKKDSSNNDYIPIGRKYRNFYTGEDLGYLVMYIREAALYDIYRKIVPDGGYSFIISDNRYVISHPDKNKVGNIIFDSDIFYSSRVFDHKTVKYDGKQVVLTIFQFSERLKSLGANWKIVSIISEDKLFDAVNKVNKYVIIIGIIMAVAAVFISIYISMNITDKVARLKNKVKTFGKDGSVMPLLENSGDEIWELEKSFNDMTVRINDLILKNNEEKEKQRELELIALQAQINPHFLYNTLDAIGWIAKLKKQEDIERLVMALARFFRLSLHKGDKFITIQEEIQLVQSFVTIEQMRSPGKFEINYNISDEVKDYKVLKIILQPLVENAIKHGIGKKRGNGCITVNCFKMEDKLKFEVIDDGVGFDINSTDFRKAYENTSHSGYGLRNVDERIKLEYGQEFGLIFHSEENKGTLVEVLLSIKP
jgi:Predicted signal transduction protein with a C-terminal ATPase domain